MSPVLPPFYLQAPSLTPMTHLPTARSLYRCQLRNSKGLRTWRSRDRSPALAEFTPAEGLGSKHQEHLPAQLWPTRSPAFPRGTACCLAQGPLADLPHGCVHPSSFRAGRLAWLHLERTGDLGGSSRWIIGRASLSPCVKPFLSFCSRSEHPKPRISPQFS